MDTSEKYIKMCEKAKRDLYGDGAIFLYDLYSMYYDADTKKVISGLEILYKLQLTGIVSTTDNINTWPLPRQDQLQEMVKDIAVSERKLAVYFGRYCEDYGEFNYSLEKLWLAFVMHEKYNKVWNGEDWIKES